MMRPINNNSKQLRVKSEKKQKVQRNGPKKGKMTLKPWQSGLAFGGVIALIGIVVLGGVYGGWFAWLGANITPTRTGYSVNVHDGFLDATLNNDEFAYDLWGSNDSTDWAEFDHIEAGLTLDSIKAGDMESDEYEGFYVNMTGSVAHDEDVYDVDLGTRTYGERWFKIYNDRANDFAMYETPNNVFIIVLFAGNGTRVNMTLNTVLVGTNISIVVGNNATQTDAIYVPYYDYAAQETVQLNIITYFDADVEKNDFKIDGMSGTHSVAWGTNGTNLYNLGALAPGISLFSGNWRGATINGAATRMMSLRLLWGTTSLVFLA